MVAPRAPLPLAQSHRERAAVGAERTRRAVLVGAGVSKSPITPDFLDPQPFNVDIGEWEMCQDQTQGVILAPALTYDPPDLSRIEPDADLYPNARRAGVRGRGVRVAK